MSEQYKQDYSQPSYRFFDKPADREDVTAQLISGLQRHPKSIAPKFFYDERGSKLFSRITQTREYYPTRTEIGLLNRYGREIAACIGERSLLIEYGSGSSEKIRILLDILRPSTYAPLDISRDYLEASAGAIAVDYPWLEVVATCVDYTRDFELPFDLLENTAGFFPGSSIGNFDPAAAVEFLILVRKQLGAKGGLLIGVDLKKDKEILNRAYNDVEGITAAFNLNVLAHLNEKYGADFDIDSYEHQAGYNAELGCIQMFLKSKREQVVTIANERFILKQGERIHTENSYKYTKQQFLEMAYGAGFVNHKVWTDDRHWFAVIYLY